MSLFDDYDLARERARDRYFDDETESERIRLDADMAAEDERRGSIGTRLARKDAA